MNIVKKLLQKQIAIIPTMLVFWDRLIIKELLDKTQQKRKSLLMPEAIEQTSRRLVKILEKQNPRYLLDKIPNMKTNRKTSIYDSFRRILHNLYIKIFLK